MSKLEKAAKAMNKGIKVLEKVEKQVVKSNQTAAHLRKDHITPKHLHKTHKNSRIPRPATNASGKRIEYRDGLIEPPRTQQIMTAWDEMTLAKLSPGNTNPPYVAGMNVTQVPTMTFSVTNTLSSCYQLDINADNNPEFTIQPIGTAPYLFLFWVPAATAYYGPGTPGFIKSSDKLGGMCVIQITSAAMDSPAFDRTIIGSNYFAKTMVEVYGSDMDGFSEGGFVWAAQADVKIVTPEANLIGAMMRGNLTYGQIPTIGRGLSGNELLKISQTAKIAHGFHMRSSVFNNNILFDSQTLGTGGAQDSHFASEVVNYVIVQQGAGSITTGGSIPYTLILNIVGNGAFWQNPFDSLANNLFTNNVSGTASAMPGMLSGIDPNSMNHIPKPAGSHKEPLLKRIGHAIKSAGKFVWDHRQSIVSGLEAAAPLLLMEPAPAPNDHLQVRTADYIYRLRSIQRSLGKLDLQASQTVPLIGQLNQLVQYELQYQQRVASSFTQPTRRMRDAQLTFSQEDHELPEPVSDGSLVRSINQATAQQMVRASKAVVRVPEAPALTSSESEKLSVLVRALRDRPDGKDGDASRLVQDLFNDQSHTRHDRQHLTSRCRVHTLCADSSTE